MNTFDPSTQKIQYALYDINGNLYKKGFVSSYKRLSSTRNRASLKYGGGLSLRTVIVPKTQTAFAPMEVKVAAQYCFCADTPIYVQKCDKCGKSPYTD